MDWEEPFPLNAVPPRVETILNEFKGRCPSMREVAETPDALARNPQHRPDLPQQIRNVTDAPPEQTVGPPGLG